MAKLKINVDSVSQHLSQVAGVVNSKNPLPILGDVVFTVNNDGLFLTSSDGETWLTIKTPCIEYDEPMMFCVSATDICKVLANLKGKDVEMVLDHDTHTVKCSYGNGRFSLPFEAADDFPRPMMDTTDAVEKEINAVKVQRAIRKTIFAIADDKLRPILNGIHFGFLENGMVAESTDGQKLAKYTDLSIVLKDGEQQSGFTLPKKPSNIVLGLLNGCEGMIKITFSSSCVTFQNEDNGFTLRTRLLEGNYPLLDRVIPKDNMIETAVKRDDIIEALKRVMPMGNETSQLVTFDLRLGEVTVFAENIDFSKCADESIPCDYAGQDFTIAFNGGYLMEILQSIDSENVNIRLKDPKLAGLFQPSNQDDGCLFQTVLVPLFIQQVK